MAALGPFDARRRVVAAVSGGADSMALAMLLARWGDVVAAIVDHGLRPGSGEEAAQTAASLARLGIAADILSAALPRGSTAEQARNARYRLLLAHCRRSGRPDLVLAHHSHDQAETVWMRRSRRSGIGGLAAMAPISWRDDARLLRPFLGIAPARLRATLIEAGVGWIEDPSNVDRRFERARVRAAMTQADRTDAVCAAADAARVRTRREIEDAAALAGIELRPEGYAVVSRPLSRSALSSLLWALSGRDHPPARAALDAGLETRSVHGVLIRPAGRLGPGTLLCREPACVAPPRPALDGAVWDGRFRLSGDVPPGYSLGALGRDATALRRRSRLPATVLATLPALRLDGLLQAVPHLQCFAGDVSRRVRIEFWPVHPVAPSPFTGADVDPALSRGM